jgi:hypothetical protein
MKNKRKEARNKKKKTKKKQNYNEVSQSLVKSSPEGVNNNRQLFISHTFYDYAAFSSTKVARPNEHWPHNFPLSRSSFISSLFPFGLLHFLNVERRRPPIQRNKKSRTISRLAIA